MHLIHKVCNDWFVCPFDFENRDCQAKIWICFMVFMFLRMLLDVFSDIVLEKEQLRKKKQNKKMELYYNFYFLISEQNKDFQKEMTFSKHLNYRQ